jgi:hypothetical protein
MPIKIVKNEHGRFTYEVDGERVHDSWPTIAKARRAALLHKESPKPVKPVVVKEPKNGIPAV